MKKVFPVLMTAILIAFALTSNGQQLNLPQSLSANSGLMETRQPDSRAWTDPALNHNRLLQQQSEGTYTMVGAFKVTGTSFLFGEHHKADMFTPDAKAYNIYVSYNTYNQEVEFYSTSNPSKPLVREPGSVDSFIIQANPAKDIARPLKFVWGAMLGSKEKYYFQEVCSNGRFTLYKKYKSELGYSTTNLAQSEIRQFDLQIEYYYADAQGKGLKKIKPSAPAVIKEFKDIKDLSNDLTVDEFSVNPEAAFCKAFSLLDQKGF